MKCIDRDTGEEIYYNTALPKGLGSWATEEEALKAIGAKIADEFSRDFFLQHVQPSGRKVTLTIDGWPGGAADDALVRELVGLPAVIAVTPQLGVRRASTSCSSQAAAPPAIASRNGVLKPLNAKLGQPCFSLGAISGERVASLFDPALRRPLGAVAARDQSAGGPVRRAARAAEERRQESRDAEKARDLTSVTGPGA